MRARPELSKRQFEKTLDQVGDISRALAEAEREHPNLLDIKDPEKLAELKRHAQFWKEHHYGENGETDRRADLILALPDIETEQEI